MEQIDALETMWKRLNRMRNRELRTEINKLDGAEATELKSVEVMLRAADQLIEQATDLIQVRIDAFQPPPVTPAAKDNPVKRRRTGKPIGVLAGNRRQFGLRIAGKV